MVYGTRMWGCWSPGRLGLAKQSLTTVRSEDVQMRLRGYALNGSATVTFTLVDLNGVKGADGIIIYK